MKAGMPTIIGYYTKDTAYERDCRALIVSLEALNIPYHFYAIRDQGSWLANTQYKAIILHRSLKECRWDHICYVDVDALVLKRPKLLTELKYSPYDCATYRDRAGTIHNGTIYLANNQRARMLLIQWIKRNAEFPEKLPDGREAWDQRTFQMALNDCSDVRFKALPASYCYIIGYSQECHPNEDPIILHTRGRLKGLG